MSEIIVEMATYILKESPQVLVARGLGSCVAVSLYYREKRIGALCHAMLPSNQEKVSSGNPLRFLDHLLYQIFNDFEAKGISTFSLEAKIVGGANMFPALNKESDFLLTTGEKNIEMARKILKEKGVLLVGEEVGGHYGRSVKFHLETGILTVEKKI